MTDEQAIVNNTSAISAAKSEWKFITPQDRNNWLRIFGHGALLTQLGENNAEATSGDPEDADIPECPSV